MGVHVVNLAGCDLSNWQQQLPDLSQYSFVFHKCTEGTGYIDPLYVGRHDIIRKMGKVFGAYHYYRTNVDVIQQVEWFIDHANLMPGDIAVLDFEDDGTWNNGFNHRTLASQASRFMMALADHYPSRRIMIYCNRSSYDTIIKPYGVYTGDGIWLASPGYDPVDYPHIFVQTGSDPIDIDMSSSFSSFNDLVEWTIGKGDIMALNTQWIFEPGKAMTTFEVGSNNSQVVRRLWVCAKPLYAGIDTDVNIVMCDDTGGNVPIVDTNCPTGQIVHQWMLNHRLWWEAGNGASHVTFEWDAGKIDARTRFVPYLVTL